MHTEALSQLARDQSLAAWQEAWWEKTPHTQLDWNRGHIVQAGSLSWFWRY